MVRQTDDEGSRSQRDAVDSVFSCLSAAERRHLLERLSRQAPEPTPRGDLTAALAAWLTGKPPDEVTAEERERAAVALHHQHLPKLADAGLVECDGDAVTPADHPAYRDEGIVEALNEAAGSSAALDTLFDALADGRRRAVLDTLSHQFGPIHVETLARELVADDREQPESDVPSDPVERTLVELRHATLPQLSEADLIEYDTEADTVAYSGHPALRVPWMHSVLGPAFRTSLTGESEPDGIGEVQGRQDVVSFGQSLFDRADEEMFCMFTDTGLLEAGCLTRIRDASRRGVDVYLGTPNPTVREYIREHAPEVVLWEPGTNWLNLPLAEDRVGRLLLADREAVMLGTLLEQGGDDVSEEQAIVGEGEDDTLVTMVRQLVGLHLEEIDKNTEDVEARLPL